MRNEGNSIKITNEFIFSRLAPQLPHHIIIQNLWMKIVWDGMGRMRTVRIATEFIYRLKLTGIFYYQSYILQSNWLLVIEIFPKVFKEDEKRPSSGWVVAPVWFWARTTWTIPGIHKSHTVRSSQGDRRSLNIVDLEKKMQERARGFYFFGSKKHDYMVSIYGLLKRCIVANFDLKLMI